MFASLVYLRTTEVKEYYFKGQQFEVTLKIMVL